MTAHVPAVVHVVVPTGQPTVAGAPLGAAP